MLWKEDKSRDSLWSVVHEMPHQWRKMFPILVGFVQSLGRRQTHVKIPSYDYKFFFQISAAIPDSRVGCTEKIHTDYQQLHYFTGRWDVHETKQSECVLTVFQSLVGIEVKHIITALRVLGFWSALSCFWLHLVLISINRITRGGIVVPCRSG